MRSSTKGKMASNPAESRRKAFRRQHVPNRLPGNVVNALLHDQHSFPQRQHRALDGVGVIRRLKLDFVPQPLHGGEQKRSERPERLQRVVGLGELIFFEERHGEEDVGTFVSSRITVARAGPIPTAISSLSTQLPATCLLKCAVTCHQPAQIRSYLPPACSNTQLPATCLLKYAVTCYLPAIWLVGNQYPKRSGHGVDHHARMRRMPERLRARPPITSRSFLQRRPS